MVSRVKKVVVENKNEMSYEKMQKKIDEIHDREKLTTDDRLKNGRLLVYVFLEIT